jgi:16S rRNA (adenine1518-N6/adenine1519-N6)-dimethyltransferase
MDSSPQHNPPCYDSAAAIKAFLDARSLAALKKFGQNFLLNEAARTTLINALDAGRETPVWEVGPGLGVMTRPILETGARLTVFEIDKGFCAFLRETFAREAEDGRFSLVEGDALKTLLQRLNERQKDGCAVIPVRLFGNLPYNIAAALIAKTIESGARFCRAVVTVQKEVAERMTSLPGSKNYSSLTVLCSWAYTIKKIADFPGSFFWPSPAVDSRALLFVPNGSFAADGARSEALQRVTRAAFSSRRKTIKNNLLALCGAQTEALLERCGINPQTRAENLPVEDFLCLSREYAAVQD